MHGRDILFDQLLTHETHGIIATDLIMHRHGLRIGVTHQGFANRQLQCREALKANLLGKFHHAGLTHTRFACQLLRTQMAGVVGLRKQKIRQLFVALSKAGITLANAN